MKTLGISMLGCLLLLIGIKSALSDNIVWQNGFERELDVPGSIMEESSSPAVVRNCIDASEAVEGKSSLLMTLRFRKTGYCYPYFSFGKRVRLEDGPLYLSGYFKVVQQSPDTDHSFALVVTGEYPRKASGWKGFHALVAKKKELDNGWTYFYSENLQETIKKCAKDNQTPFEDAYADSFFVRIWGIEAGEKISFRLDNVRLTRNNPVPAPDEAVYVRVMELYRQMQDEKAALAKISDSATQEFVAGIESAARILENKENQDEAVVKTLLVGKVRQIEKLYWRLKIMQLTAAEGLK